MKKIIDLTLKDILQDQAQKNQAPSVKGAIDKRG